MPLNSILYQLTGIKSILNNHPCLVKIFLIQNNHFIITNQFVNLALNKNNYEKNHYFFICSINNSRVCPA